jgi:tetratricopeptide (TPR) repeat protein
MKRSSLLLCITLSAVRLLSADAFDDADKALAAGDYAKAISTLESVLSTTPDSLRAGSQYRQAVLKAAMAAHPKQGAPGDFDHEIDYLQKLSAAHGDAGNAFLNFGFTYVDKIPAAGSITQVILANNALTAFSKSIEVKPTWIALYTRGNSYLYWPRIFGRAQLGVTDLEKAYEIQKKDSRKPYHIRVFISLGDGYWKTDQLERARGIWQEGLKQFPDNQLLKDRLARQGDDLQKYIDDVLDPGKRVDTDLRELWMYP